MAVTAPADILQSLSRDERLLWSGVPKQGLMFRAGDAFLIPFSLLWCGFVIFWEWTAVTANAPVFMKLWGIPFVLAGLYITVGRFIYDMLLRARTDYAVTSERIIISSRLGSRRIKSIDLGTLPEITLTMTTATEGTLTFGSNVPYMYWSQQTAYRPPAFEGIPDAARVAALSLFKMEAT